MTVRTVMKDGVLQLACDFDDAQAVGKVCWPESPEEEAGCIHFCAECEKDMDKQAVVGVRGATIEMFDVAVVLEGEDGELDTVLDVQPQRLFDMLRPTGTIDPIEGRRDVAP